MGQHNHSRPLTSRGLSYKSHGWSSNDKYPKGVIWQDIKTSVESSIGSSPGQMPQDYAYWEDFSSHLSNSMATRGVLRTVDDVLMCNECGTQYSVTHSMDACKVCDVSNAQTNSTDPNVPRLIPLVGSETIRSSNWSSIHHDGQVESWRLQECLVARWSQPECMVCSNGAEGNISIRSSNCWTEGNAMDSSQSVNVQSSSRQRAATSSGI